MQAVTRPAGQERTESAILLFGAAGQVGTTFLSRADNSHDLLGFAHGELDICDETAVRSAICDRRPAAIINAAAYTAVDKAEIEVERAFAVNRDGARILALAAAEASVPILHLSTDYVFAGNKRSPYAEEDAICPLNVYGESKAAGEQAIREACPRHIILRTSRVYSAIGNNFLRTMLRLARERSEIRVVDDQIGSPTAARDIARCVLNIVAQIRKPDFDKWGTYHYRGADIVSWFEFAKRIFAEAQAHGRPTPRLIPITTADYPTAARRPVYSVLDAIKLRNAFGIELRSLNDGIRDCLDTISHDGL